MRDTNTIRALIADDEPLLRDMLKLRLSQVWPELRVIAEAGNGAEAVSLFETWQPDIVFLDIKMPVMSGIDAARSIARRAQVVFVTAFDDSAVEAFNQGAIDYVMKPVTVARLAETVERLKERTQKPAQITPELEQLFTLLGQPKQAGNNSKAVEPLRWIKGLSGEDLHLVAIDDVIYFQSEDKFTKVVTATQSLTIKKPIKELVDTLCADTFWQIHRATIVNINKIARVGRDHRDQPIVHLRDRQETLTVSRAFAHLFKQM
ncbi:LytTR family DNA-binding domain-containing protein [Burkholderiaceae bacterium DAT-1]|nr:LytTR family DNA-binding domain-containing protein [Burkholderiaceae bacterium DAT-1]